MRYGRSVVKRANLGDGLFDALMEQLQLHKFDGTADTGFAVRYWTQHTAFIYFITRETTFRTIFDPVACSFTKMEVTEPKVTPFLLDERSGTLEVFGAKTAATEALTTLGKLSSFRLSLKDIEVSPLAAIRRLEDAKVLSHVKSIRIVDWEITPGVLGSCTINSVDTCASAETLGIFGRSIASATLVTRFYGRNVPVGVYRDGALNIGVDLDEDPETYEELKHLVLGGI